jgi:hypothetical protein
MLAVTRGDNPEAPVPRNQKAPVPPEFRDTGAFWLMR